MKIFSRLTSAWIGIFVLICVLYFGVFHGFSDISIFLNTHALILVFGGTLAVSLLSYPLSTLAESFDFLIFGFLLKQKSHLREVVHTFILSSFEMKVNDKNPDQIKTENGFTRDALNLIYDNRYSADDAESILDGIKESFNRRYTEHARILTNISKFPPALGLLGASTGMIKMMMNLGTGGSASIGAAMAIALTATFWGIAMANFIFLPLADYAFKLADEDLYLRSILIDGVYQIKSGVPFPVVAETLCGRLPIFERFQVLNSLKKTIDFNLYDKKQNQQSLTSLRA